MIFSKDGGIIVGIEKIKSSIEYGNDGNGMRVYPDKAMRGRTYKCPYCDDEIHVRKCNDRDDYFAHKSISNRTPEQMTCPGYTGPGKIENPDDQLYIINGGVPLHLVENTEQHFQLIALFPPLSEESYDYLAKWNVKVEIIGDGPDEIFTASNLRRYHVKSANKRIKIKCINMKGVIAEVSKKWEWGIKEFKFDNDIFMSDFGGGSRVAKHSNIVIGKEYLIVHKFGELEDIRGIKFKTRGDLALSNMSSIRKEYEVYSLTVTEANNESIAFIQSKGYQLIEKNDEIIPLWPPAVIEGKELIYKKGNEEAFLYHKKQSRQKVFLCDIGIISQVFEDNNLIKSQTNNKVLIISDYEFNELSREIRYFLTQERQNYNVKRYFEAEVYWKYKNGIKEIICETLPNKIYHEDISIISNTIILALVYQNGYVVRSCSRLITKIKKGQALIIQNNPFAIIILTQFIDKDKIKYINKAQIIEKYVKKLYDCESKYIVADNKLDSWIIKAQAISEELYKILLYWKTTRQMPSMAEVILKELEGKLYGENN